MHSINDGTFEKLEVWQRSVDVTIRIYQALASCRDFAFRDQITRSANSIPANIAEGAERNSKPEFKQFLGYAKGSAGETRSHIYIANRLGYLDNDIASDLLTELKRISRMLNALISKLQMTQGAL